jgi:hypothetical protein
VGKGQTDRLGGSVDAVAQPLASPSIHKERKHFVENVVIEPATAGALVRSVVDQGAFDLEKPSPPGR